MNITCLLLFANLMLYTGSYSQDDLSVNNLKNSIGMTIDFPIQKNTNSNGQLQPQDLNYDCDTVFWTVNFSGQVQQWNLISNQISGGTVVTTGAGFNLAFCGENQLTFYSTSNIDNTFAITRYDSNLGWVHYPTTVLLSNNGGYHENQYFYQYLGFETNLYHYNGSLLTLIDTVTDPNSFEVARHSCRLFGSSLGL